MIDVERTAVNSSCPLPAGGSPSPDSPWLPRTAGNEFCVIAATGHDRDG
jgi:hypothetical protein